MLYSKYCFNIGFFFYTYLHLLSSLYVNVTLYFILLTVLKVKYSYIYCTRFLLKINQLHVYEKLFIQDIFSSPDVIVCQLFY